MQRLLPCWIRGRIKLTEDEYLAFDRHHDIKHEFINGEVVAMTGASWKHNIICANTSAALHSQLTDSPCIVTASDMRLKIAASSTYRYPDVMVVCDDPQFIDDRSDTVLNPVILIEVLSPSTALVDRNEKLREYRQIDSLQAYILLSQDSSRAERYLRQDPQNWLYTDITGLGTHIELTSIGCTLALKDVYSKVTF